MRSFKKNYKLGGSSLRTDSARFVIKLLMSGTLFLIGSYVVAGSSSAIQFIDGHRPDQSQLSRMAFIEAQFLHVKAQSERDAGKPKIAFVGSSSVVNGIDVAEIDKILRAGGIDVVSLNDGMTSFTAAELPFLKKELLRNDVDLIVYAYNSF